MFPIQRLREGLARVLRFADDSVSLLYVQAAIVVIAVILAPIVSLGSHAAASDLCFLAAILVSVYGQYFDARLLLGASGAQWVRRLMRMADESAAAGHSTEVKKSTPLGELWYWSSFVQMWTPWVLMLLGFIAPWESGRYLQFLAITVMILWAVSTQRVFGTFWRKVNMYTTMGILACSLFGIYAAGWQVQVRENWHREQELNEAKSEATTAQTADDKAYLANLHKQDSQYKAMYRRHLRDARGLNNQPDADWTNGNAADWDVVTKQINELENPEEGVTATVANSAGTITDLPEKHPGWLVIGGLILLAAMGGGANDGHAKKH